MATRKLTIARHFEALLMLFALAVGAPTVSAQSAQVVRSIIIQESTQRGYVINSEGKVGEKRVELSCTPTPYNGKCNKLATGEYFFRFATASESVYTDCNNVVLFDITPQKTAGNQRGVFCFAGDIRPW